MARRFTIAFDASCLATPQKTGVATYTDHLVRALAEHYPEARLVGHYCGRRSPGELELPAAPNIHYRRSRLISSRVLNMARRLGVWLPFELLTKTRADFHLFPAFIGWPSLFGTPSTCIIHDLAYLEVPETVSALNRHDLTKLIPSSLRRSAFILTPSQATRDALKKTYGAIVPPCVVTYIPPAPEAPLSPTEARAEVQKLGIAGDYLLFVGTLEPRKNIVGLLQAYGKLPESLRETHPLVLAGSLGWNSQEITAALEAARQAQLPVVHTGYISNRQKTALYMHAHLLVQPSIYEGFGMPILEAMAHGLPVVASDIPVFHEIADTAAAYVAPSDTAALTHTLQQLLTNRTAYNKLAGRSSQHLLHAPSWEQIADKAYSAMAEHSAAASRH